MCTVNKNSTENIVVHWKNCYNDLLGHNRKMSQQNLQYRKDMLSMRKLLHLYIFSDRKMTEKFVVTNLVPTIFELKDIVVLLENIYRFDNFIINAFY